MTGGEEHGVADAENCSPPPVGNDGKSEYQAKVTGKKSMLLPEVTDEIVALHQAEKEDLARTPSREGEHKECCGIPYYLVLALLVLGVAVVTGTVLLVVYYDGDDETDSPTPSPSTP